MKLWAIFTLPLALLLFALATGRSPIQFYIRLLKDVFSLPVNYAAYYFKKYLLRRSDQEILGNGYDEFVAYEKRKQRKLSLPNIAVVNRNYHKYTETFISQRIIDLETAGYYVHWLFGGYFPTDERFHGPLLSRYQTVQGWFRFLESLLNLKQGHYLRRSFRKYLKRNSVKLVFLEFGTVGAQVFEECVACGIPFVVTFHGYDAHHKEIRATNTGSYRRMITAASKVICVARDILNVLSSEFGEGSKMVYLPSAMNTAPFTYADRSTNKPVFIAVGRFSETKAPHLTILAFNEVLKQVPDAQLVLIGKDGGGDLFEACVILVKALGIESSVVFKGVMTPIEVALEMTKAQVFVQHSVETPINHDKEGTPVSVREAMLSGLPVVVTRHAGIAELVQHGVNGLVVDEYDHLAMANELLRLVRSPELARNLGKNGSESIRSNDLIMRNDEAIVAIAEAHRIK